MNKRVCEERENLAFFSPCISALKDMIHRLVTSKDGCQAQVSRLFHTLEIHTVLAVSLQLWVVFQLLFQYMEKGAGCQDMAEFSFCNS